MVALRDLRGGLRARTNPSSYGEQVDEDAPDPMEGLRKLFGGK